MVTKVIENLKTESEEAEGVAVEVSLDKAGKEAFARLAGSLPLLSEEYSEVAKVLSVLKDTVKVVPSTDSEPGYNLKKASKDLAQVAKDIQCQSLSSLLEKASKVFASNLSVPKTQYDLVEKRFEVLKNNGEQRTVLGIVLEPETVDSQGDIYSEDEITKTAWKFLENYQNFGLMHSELVPEILPLESYVAPTDFNIGGQVVKKGTWVLRVRVLDDEIWDKVKSGDLTGFSIGGSAVRTPVSLRS